MVKNHMAIFIWHVFWDALILTGSAFLTFVMVFKSYFGALGTFEGEFTFFLQ